MTKKTSKKSTPELPPATLEAIRKCAEILAGQHGLALHDVTFGPTDFGLTLSVIIEAPNGRPLSVTDCEVVSRPLSKELDDLMGDFGENYLLEVTSLGIEEEEV